MTVNLSKFYINNLSFIAGIPTCIQLLVKLQKFQEISKLKKDK